MLYGPNTNLGGNSIIYMLEGQIRYVLGALSALDDGGLDWLDVRPEVQVAFNEWVGAASRTSVWESGCHSWYTTASGRNTNNWPDHTFLYRYRVRHFDLAGYRLAPEHPYPAALSDAASVMSALLGEVPTGSVVVAGDAPVARLPAAGRAARGRRQRGGPGRVVRADRDGSRRVKR